MLFRSSAHDIAALFFDKGIKRAPVVVDGKIVGLVSRAERRLVALAPVGRHLRPLVLQYVNRLSDLLWLMARDAERG